MHWIKRNIGDYHKKAGRLTMLQHGAYTLLMDACYDREEFPTMEQAMEWTWASTKDEIDAVEFVLQRFFVLLDDGRYEQGRIHDEITNYQANRVINKRIAKERETKRRENGTNRGKKARSVNEPPPNQEPEPEPEPSSPIVPKGDSGGAVVNVDRETAKMALELMALISNRKFKPIDSNMKPILARLADGHTAQDIGEVLRHQWLQWKGSENEKYFRPSTLFRPSKFEGYLNDANNPVVTKLTRSTRDISLQESLTDTSWAD